MTTTDRARTTAALGGLVELRDDQLREVRLVRRRGRLREYGIVGVLLVLLAAAFCLSLSLGDLWIPLPDVARMALGLSADAPAPFIVGELRFPRAAMAVMVGLAFGMAGTILQQLVRNPLASPDIIGVTYGASASAVVAILVFGASGYVLSVWALVGGLGAAALVYGLSWSQGVTGYRMILIGIGVAAVGDSLTAYFLTRAKLYEASVALRWLTGSLSDASESQVHVLGWCLVVLVPVTLLLSRWIRPLQLGDESARELGLRVETSRLSLVVASVLLASVATAAAGPIAFVALMAGPVAGLLTGKSGGGLISSGLVGALLVVVSDMVGQHLLSQSLPVGVITGIIGAPYLIWLLIRMNRIGGAN
ncbi:iron chelate uptake ABC transporter family permease subunit [Williamsia sp. 1135]|uniref:FecCD family ABC transporter permease n=1 Tax=Williamsia sp. 1135 TaxID=1889262 RepID=UPI001F0B4BF9|nr:iron chelate uptake ABC transporter family permease subunit [Williamsia sp. 1135]